MKLLLVLILSTLVISSRAAKNELIRVRTERAELVRFNPKFAHGVEVRTFKYNRTTTALNMTFNLKITVGDESKVVVQGYKFSSNEYRLFPMVFDAPVCASLKSNYFGVQNLGSCGNFKAVCPIKPGYYHLCNWTPDDAKFPPHLLPGRFQVNMRLMYGSEEIGVGNWYVEVKDEWIPWA